MLRIRMQSDLPVDEQLRPAANAIRGGGLVAYPTDTLYGLAVDPRSASAVHALFRAKQRAPDQAIPLIAESAHQVAEHVGVMTPLADRLASYFWPGPLTLIIPASATLCVDLHRGSGTIAVRVPDHAVARGLARVAGHAVTSTSANVSGFPATSDPHEVARVLGAVLDVLIDGGPSPGGLPSTVIDATGTDPVLVRAGAVPWDRVLKFLH